MYRAVRTHAHTGWWWIVKTVFFFFNAHDFSRSGHESDATPGGESLWTHAAKKQYRKIARYTRSGTFSFFVSKRTSKRITYVHVQYVCTFVFLKVRGTVTARVVVVAVSGRRSKSATVEARDIRLRLFAFYLRRKQNVKLRDKKLAESAPRRIDEICTKLWRDGVL